MPFPPHARVTMSNRQLSTTLAGEVVILTLHDGVYYGLNEVGAYVWQLLQSPRRVCELLDGIVAEYDVTRETADADLQQLLAELAERQLVDIDDA